MMSGRMPSTVKQACHFFFPGLNLKRHKEICSNQLNSNLTKFHFLLGVPKFLCAVLVSFFFFEFWKEMLFKSLNNIFTSTWNKFLIFMFFWWLIFYRKQSKQLIWLWTMSLLKILKVLLLLKYLQDYGKWSNKGKIG